MQEFVDFLGRHAPYDGLETAELKRLGRRVKVAFYRAGETIVESGKGHFEHLAIVRTGLVQMLDRSQVVDELGPGDTFGQYWLLGRQSATVAVRAATDTLLYLLPDPATVLEHPEALRFESLGRGETRRTLLTSAAIDSTMRPVTDHMSPPLWCDSRVTIREAARVMTQARGSCVLIRLGRELGIMTDSDCRKRVATGEMSVHSPLSSIVSAPAMTIRSDATAASAFTTMVHHGVHHLVVLDPRGEVVGVCRAIDLAAAEIRDPLTIRASIDQATSLEELSAAAGLLRPTCVDLYDAGVPPLRIGAILSAMIDAVLEKVVRWTPPFDEAGDAYAWSVLGSVARREPLPTSDVDTALIWANPTDKSQTQIILQQADEVIQGLERCGLERCPDGANASNPLFGRPYEQWVQRASKWYANPDAEGALLLGAMLADSRAVTGLVLGRSLDEAVHALPGSDDFARRTLANALTHRPPLGFVKDFVVDHDGEHRGKLNLKQGGLSPIVGLGRWVAVKTRSPIASTQDRLQQGLEAGLLTADECAQLQHAHREIFEMIFVNQIEAIREGVRPSTWIDPREIDTLRRRHLRSSFKAIHRVQSRLEAERGGP
ncbi:MAG: putative nucleotidyltransferase substrate binding domain-containing protein [Nocardioides sp.]|jgi:CBS domain-containing protein